MKIVGLKITNAALRMAMEERWRRAEELIRAQDNMALLAHCQLYPVTPGAQAFPITEADVDRLRTAQKRWAAVG